MRSAIRFAALLGIFGAAACGGLSSDPADGLNFRPPQGWTSDIRLLGIDVFASPGRTQFMTLSTMSPGPDLEQRLMNGATYRNPRGTERSIITICGDKTAEYTTAVVYFISGRRDMNLEMITKERTDDVLVADYVYPIGSKPDKTAEAAIRALCPTGT